MKINQGQAAMELGTTVHHLRKMVVAGIVTPVSSAGKKPRFDSKDIIKRKKEINIKYAEYLRNEPKKKKKTKRIIVQSTPSPTQPTLWDTMTTGEREVCKRLDKIIELLSK